MFYDKVLQANDSVLDLLHNGYKPDIVTKLPEATDLRNNLSALQNIQFVYTKTDKWIKERIVAKVNHKPYFVNPITVAQKLDGEGNLKLRQCVDLSRTLNDCLRKVKMKMEDIGAVLPRVTPGCWMSVLDISSMYCHLRIHPQFRSLFGFAVVNPSGVREFYECLTLPFGTGRNSLHILHFCIFFDEGMLKEHNEMLQNLLTHISFCGLRTLNFGESKRKMFIVFPLVLYNSFFEKNPYGFILFSSQQFLELFLLGPATFIMNSLILPIRRYCHSRGVDISTFVDDSINCALSKIKGTASLKFIKFMFECTGWELNILKCVGPTTVLCYLGFNINSISMRISAPQMKIIILTNDINKAVSKFNETGFIHAKELAHILGVCCHLISSHGNVMRVVTRACQQTLGQTVQEKGWKGSLVINDRMLQEFDMLQTFLIRCVHKF